MKTKVNWRCPTLNFRIMLIHSKLSSLITQSNSSDMSIKSLTNFRHSLFKNLVYVCHQRDALSSHAEYNMIRNCCEANSKHVCKTTINAKGNYKFWEIWKLHQKLIVVFASMRTSLSECKKTIFVSRTKNLCKLEIISSRDNNLHTLAPNIHTSHSIVLLRIIT